MKKNIIFCFFIAVGAMFMSCHNYVKFYKKVKHSLVLAEDTAKKIRLERTQNKDTIIIKMYVNNDLRAYCKILENSVTYEEQLSSLITLYKDAGVSEAEIQDLIKSYEGKKGRRHTPANTSIVLKVYDMYDNDEFSCYGLQLNKQIRIIVTNCSKKCDNVVFTLLDDKPCDIAIDALGYYPFFIDSLRLERGNYQMNVYVKMLEMGSHGDDDE